ncbi:MAG: osmotically inducible protein OsmC [Phormidesmis priestleyi Ana]|uniref:Osmotically inducible protein OsmC n=1 Tax=Phormidesmis priestleyi Ana TaxID=1666911 RepID=A0A0P8BUF7_9CYAN|nr:MAG: osmotically inducible protein OsmC [Phormidesmis priestleyi Ana]
MDSTATVVWQGSVPEGEGKITTESGVLKESVYTYGTRFKGNPGTNPEELIAAAHAACFSMAVTDELGSAGITPDEIQTVAKVTLSTEGNEPEVTQIHLDVTAKLPNNDQSAQEMFEKAAKTAKENCPISRLLNADIRMDTHLAS